MPDTKDQPSPPTINRNGLIEPTIADAMFLAISTPGYDGGTGLNLLVWGAPGTGKTATSKDVIARAGRSAFYVDLSLSAPEDLAGIPRVMFAELSEDGKVIRYHFTTDKAPTDKLGRPKEMAVLSVRAIDATWMSIFNDPHAVLIADDLTNAAQMVQAAMLRIALEKQVSDGKGGLMGIKHMAFLAMANFGDGNALQPLLGPLANRFSHIEATTGDVLRWWNSDMKSQLTLDVSKRDGLEATFPALYQKNLRMVNEFIKEHQLAAFDVPPTDFTTVQEHAYASSRTYEFCARWLAACEHFGVQPDRFIRASIGDRKAQMLIPWLRTREIGLKALANSVDWNTVDTAERVAASMWAARHFETSSELSGLIKSIDSLIQLSGGSQDNNVPARDYLIHRALGLPVKANGQVDERNGRVEAALTDEQVALIRKAWTAQYLSKRFKHIGPEASDRGLAA